MMQTIATKVFIVASLVFGVTGVINILTGASEDGPLFKLLIISVFVILPSFALSVAGKYLSDK